MQDKIQASNSMHFWGHLWNQFCCLRTSLKSIFAAWGHFWTFCRSAKMFLRNTHENTVLTSEHSLWTHLPFAMLLGTTSSIQYYLQQFYVQHTVLVQQTERSVRQCMNSPHFQWWLTTYFFLWCHSYNTSGVIYFFGLIDIFIE